VTAVATSSAAARGWRRFRRNRLAVGGLICLVLLYAAMVLAPLLAPYEPHEQLGVVANGLKPPSWAHPMGTDFYARDVLSRVLHGARISLTIGLLAATIAALVGTAIGALAGYGGRWLDGALMRGVDVMMAFPRLVLLLLLLALLEQRNIYLVVVVLALTGWMDVARLVRGQVLSLREREFILAARAAGLSGPRVVLRHLLPNAIAPVLISATLMVGHTILIEAGLSFLGLGVPPPVAAWGSMVEEGRGYLRDAPWIAAFPGLAIVLAVVSVNLVGDGLRDALGETRGS
jgi:peptide/nickel transport system permease protein